ncbi:hypothetical protein CA946_05965 [Fischerella thermalis 111/344/542]|nr:hypothetical protein CA946_05965 [Fischerella thermalis 111/344/542]
MKGGALPASDWFQSLIGINLSCNAGLGEDAVRARFQSLIGINLSCNITKLVAKGAVSLFQSLIGINLSCNVHPASDNVPDLGFQLPGKWDTSWTKTPGVR